jgi:hypothetical protein
VSAYYLSAGFGSVVLGSFLNGLAETSTVLKMSVAMLAIYVPLGPALAWLWGPYGLLIAYIISGGIPAVTYGLRRASMKFGARLDLKASGLILFAALGAAVPSVVFTQLDPLGTGALDLIIGGVLYLTVYVTLAPIMSAVDKQDILNLRTLFGGTLIPSTLVSPIFDYASRVLSWTKRNAPTVA